MNNPGNIIIEINKIFSQLSDTRKAIHLYAVIISQVELSIFPLEGLFSWEEPSNLTLEGHFSWEDSSIFHLEGPFSWEEPSNFTPEVPFSWEDPSILPLEDPLSWEDPSIFRLEDPFCRGAMNKKELGLWSRRGLLAYVYTGVSEWMNALVALFLKTVIN